MALRTDLSALSFSETSVWTGCSRVFGGRAMTQSSKHSSRDTTSYRERETDRQTDRQNMTCSALQYEHAKVWVHQVK